MMREQYFIGDEEVSKNIYDQFQQLKEIKVNEETGEVEEKEPLILKCKPCHNFQTIEFEWEVFEEQDVIDMFAFYSSILQGLMKMCPVESKNVEKKQTEPKEEPASQKQIEVMDKFHIKYPKDVTKKQAQELIKNNMNK